MSSNNNEARDDAVYKLKKDIEAKDKMIEDIKMQVLLKARDKNIDFEDILKADGSGTHVEEAKKELYKKDEEIKSLVDAIQREQQKSSRFEEELNKLTGNMRDK